MIQSNTPKPLTGLVIDDDRTWTTPLKLVLESELDCQVKVCSQGDAGLISLMTAKPSFVVLDWMMPGAMNGRATLAVIRQKQSFDEVPVLMATSRHQYDDIRDIMDLGADDYICKPSSFGNVVAAVGTMLSPAQAGSKSHAAARAFARNSVCRYGVD